MEAYLDNSATTWCYNEVKDIVGKTLTEDYGNPSSLHKKGVAAENYIRKAKETIANILKVNAKEIYFTSGGTESDNLALIGGAQANKRAGNHIITTQVEHPAVINAVRHLEEQGFAITWLPVDENGCITVEQLEQAITDETVLVSVMHVNNEVGSVQPVEQIGKLLKSKFSNVLFHVDAIQGFGKYKILPSKWGIDLLSVSAHKIHGPKGAGFLYASEKIKIRSVIFGGGQQRDLRPGTENVPGIAGVGEAARIIYDGLEEKVKKMQSRKEQLIQGILRIEGTTVNTPENEKGAPHIISVSFEGVKSEVLLHALEEKEIYVSSGSACSSNHPAISGTLKGMGIKDSLLDCTIRFSLSEFTTEEEIEYTLQTLGKLLPVLRRYTRH